MFSEDRRELWVIRGSQCEAPSPNSVGVGGSRRTWSGGSAGPEEDEILKMCPGWLNEEEEGSKRATECK